uniref:hypothetical protein n=1 Tax=Candidatus Stercorousia sp. TaxID=3048886 RepID=UPI004027F1D4
MKVSKNEMTKIRKHLLKQMDSFVRENISEDVVIDVWLACGLEDGWDEDILTEYATNDNLWNDCVNTYIKCCKLEGIL